MRPLLLAATLLLAACAPTAPTTADPHAGHGAGHAASSAAPDYERDVRPILVARDVLSPVPTTAPGRADAYTHEAVLMAGPSGFVVPFDAAGSLMLRFVTDLPASAEIPFPNLRRLTADERAFLARWIEAGAPGPDGRPAFADARNLLFACVQGENHVAILDAETLRIVRRVRFDEHGMPSAPYGPHHVTFEPDGSAWYVSLVSHGAVVKLSMDLALDPSSPAFVLGRTPAGAFATPGMLSLDPTSGRLFAGRSTLSDPLASGFAIIDRATMALETVATPFNVPHAFALTPDGRFALTAELTGSQALSRIAVYDTQSGDLSLVPLPATGAPRELIHFGILGAHHMMMMGMGAGHGMDHGAGHGAGHGAHGATGGGYPYTVTLTSRSTDEVLFFSLAADGALTLTGSVPTGDGPFHAHAGHDGRTILIPDWLGDTVTLIDAQERSTLRTVATPGGGPLAQPHSPAPAMSGGGFFVSSANRMGRWTPPFLFRLDGRETTARDFGNVAAFDGTGALTGVVQLGAYPAGLEPFMRPAPHGH